jgi:ATP-binding cassette, subfamily F, member 3
MPLVTISNLRMHFGGPDLLRGVALDIEPGDRVGLIGQNGTGKSTLLKLITGQLEPVDGNVFRQKGLKLAYQAQEMHAPEGATAWSEMRALFQDDLHREKRLRDLEARMAAGEDVLAEYERLQHQHESARGYDVDLRIEQVLTGLGLPRHAWQQPISSFSGGERNIIALARILLQEPDLMLLDEPSNHLDMDGIEWFIRFMRNTRAAVVMVSHNRHLLDATVKEIWELRRAKVTRWAGTYTDFARQKEEAFALQERQYNAQQRLIKRIEFQARRLRDMAKAYDDPGQAKRAQAMLKRLEMMDKIEAPDRTENRFHAHLSDGRFKGHMALSAKDLTITVQPVEPGSPPRTLLEDAELEIEYGQRVALVGPNGSGKSTLFRAVLNHASWEHPQVDARDGPFTIKGSLRTGKSARIGDYSQIHQQALDESSSLIDWFMRVTDLRFQPASEMLHRFLFTRDDLDRPIGTLSGGEKSRLQLARLVHEQVNFLMLDEPTNHLDIQASEQLEEMLDEFEGTLLIISHDRYFLDKLVNRVVELKGQGLVPFKGTFAEWWEQRHEQATQSPKGTLQLHSQKDAGQRQGEARQQREQQKTRQREQHRLKTQLKQLETRIARLEKKQSELEAKLAEAFSEGGTDEARELSDEFKAVQTEIQELYKQWEVTAEAAEQD